MTRPSTLTLTRLGIQTETVCTQQTIMSDCDEILFDDIYELHEVIGNKDIPLHRYTYTIYNSVWVEFCLGGILVVQFFGCNSKGGIMPGWNSGSTILLGGIMPGCNSVGCSNLGGNLPGCNLCSIICSEYAMQICSLYVLYAILCICIN